MVEVSIETLLVAMPPAPSVVVLRPASLETPDFEQQKDIALPGEANGLDEVGVLTDNGDVKKSAKTDATTDLLGDDSSGEDNAGSKTAKDILRKSAAILASKNVLPIWIGPSEAASIGVALEHHPQPRPMTHDLLANTIYALGANVERVVIDRVQGSTFFATVYINRDGRILNIDARPSDSIALAVRMKAPLFVDEDVMNAASHRFSLSKSGDLNDLENSEGAMDQFREFLDSITPEDFTVSE